MIEPIRIGLAAHIVRRPTVANPPSVFRNDGLSGGDAGGYRGGLSLRATWCHDWRSRLAVQRHHDPKLWWVLESKGHRKQMWDNIIYSQSSLQVTRLFYIVEIKESCSESKMSIFGT